MTGQPEPSVGQVTADQVGQRLDVYLAAKLPDVSRSQVRTLLNSGGALVNGAAGKPATKLREGDIIRVVVPLPALPGVRLEPEEIPLSVVYEDEHLVVLDKPAGMVVHPGAGHATGTLVHALLARYPELGEEGSQRPGI
ncbi:MAG: S4 domain-containing protein, partial [Chloroflexota bacterium]|nr:S4 domain-containing protein [Chloroflexota bacterium]